MCRELLEMVVVRIGMNRSAVGRENVLPFPANWGRAVWGNVTVNTNCKRHASSPFDKEHYHGLGVVSRSSSCATHVKQASRPVVAAGFGLYHVPRIPGRAEGLSRSLCREMKVVGRLSLHRAERG